MSINSEFVGSSSPKGKGLILFSGGLDSAIAAKILLKQGVALKGLSFVLPFISPEKDMHDTPVGRLAQNIGLDVEFIRVGEEYMRMLENPENGWGKQINPCIDCKIFFLRFAAKKMKDESCDFIATGEVLGQRPMSQQRNRLNQIERESGLKNNLLRPLSALLMEPTDAEKLGKVDRSQLLDISGRSRDRQFELAKELGIEGYGTPAGGCLLTDEFYAVKLKDLLKFHPSYKLIDVYLCTVGRHFRLSDTCKLIVSRDAAETADLLKRAKDADILIETLFRGPVGFIRGTASEDDIRTAGRILLRFGRPLPGDLIRIRLHYDARVTEVDVDAALAESECDKLRIL